MRLPLLLLLMYPAGLILMRAYQAIGPSQSQQHAVPVDMRVLHLLVLLVVVLLLLLPCPAGLEYEICRAKSHLAASSGAQVAAAGAHQASPAYMHLLLLLLLSLQVLDAAIGPTTGPSQVTQHADPADMRLLLLLLLSLQVSNMKVYPASGPSCSQLRC
jgi:hypothetical protein